jgi:hypothetical protein
MNYRGWGDSDRDRGIGMRDTWSVGTREIVTRMRTSGLLRQGDSGRDREHQDIEIRVLVAGIGDI